MLDNIPIFSCILESAIDSLLFGFFKFFPFLRCFPELLRKHTHLPISDMVLFWIKHAQTSMSKKKIEKKKENSKENHGR